MCKQGLSWAPHHGASGRAPIIWAYCLGTLAVARLGDGFSFGGIAARIAFLDGYRCDWAVCG